MSAAGRRAVFLDRDGTLLDCDGYLGDPAGVRLLPGAAEALGRIGRAGWLRIVVSNQSGVARNLFSEEDYRRVEAAVLAAVRSGGGDLDAVLVCHHLPGAPNPRWAVACDCRKPGPGLLLRAAAERGIDLAASVMVGDALRDLEAGRAAKVGSCVLVRTGKGRGTEPVARAMGLLDGALPSVADLPAWLDGK